MCNSNLSSNPCDQICKKQVAYGKVVEAYQFHVQRYHTWVNYYAIFVGALFVAFYTIIPQSENVQCTPCSGTIFSFLDSIWLPLLIITLGWFASMCWLASIIGHYEWMKSWIRIVKMREVDFFETTSSQSSNISPVSSEIFVYGKVMREPDRSVPNNMLPKFISTQKVTQWFVWSVILMWIASSVFLWRFVDYYWWIPSFGYSLLTAIIGYCLYGKAHKLYSSEHLDIA